MYSHALQYQYRHCTFVNIAVCIQQCTPWRRPCREAINVYMPMALHIFSILYKLICYWKESEMVVKVTQLTLLPFATFKANLFMHYYQVPSQNLRQDNGLFVLTASFLCHDGRHSDLGLLGDRSQGCLSDVSKRGSHRGGGENLVENPVGAAGQLLVLTPTRQNQPTTTAEPRRSSRCHSLPQHLHIL